MLSNYLCGYYALLLDHRHKEAVVQDYLSPINFNLLSIIRGKVSTEGKIRNSVDTKQLKCIQFKKRIFNQCYLDEVMTLKSK